MHVSHAQQCIIAVRSGDAASNRLSAALGAGTLSARQGISPAAESEAGAPAKGWQAYPAA